MRDPNLPAGQQQARYLRSRPMSMAARLDKTSRSTIIRFAFKLVFVMVSAGLSRQAFFLVSSLWLALYALATSVIGIVTRDRLRPFSFGHWDEALWLGACAALFKVLSRLF